MVVATLVGRLLGMLRDSVVLANFGAGLHADSFRIAVAVPDLIFMLVAGGGLSSAFLPVFSDFIHKDKKKEAWAAFSAVISICSIAAVVLIVSAWYFTPQLLTVYAKGQLPAVPEAIPMSRILLPAQFAFLIGSILIATLYVNGRFWVGGLAPNIYNLAMVVAGVALPRILHMGIASMAWGALTGALIGNLVLPITALVLGEGHFKPSLDINTPGVKTFFKLLLPVIFGFSLPSMVTLLTGYFAAKYSIAGANNALACANNLMQAPLGIFGASLALGVFPVLAKYVATGRMDLYCTQISKTLRTVLYLGIPSGAFMLALAPEITHCLYGYGLTAGDTFHQNAISDCLRLYSFGIFAWCMQPVLMRGFFSLHKTFKPIAIGTVMTLIFIVLCVIARYYSTDFRFIPVATDVAVFLLAVSLYIGLEMDVGRLDRGGIIATILLCGLASAVGGGVSFGLMQVLHPSSRILEIFALLFDGLCGSWVYYFITKLMKVPETDFVDRVMDKINRKMGRA